MAAQRSTAKSSALDKNLGQPLHQKHVIRPCHKYSPSSTSRIGPLQQDVKQQNQSLPAEDILDGKQGNLLAQVKLDKRDVAGEGHFKIDVLSSRALSQLVHAHNKANGGELHLDNPPFTDEVAELFATGNNIGITLAESPLCREEFMKSRPKSVSDVAACLARIRPAARQSKIEIVYDDDAIDVIQKALSCSEAEADGLRRGLAKRDTKAMAQVRRRLGAKRCKKLADDLGSLSLYGFCKAHAMSYAQLVTWLAWYKANHPVEFWAGALDSCQSSYRPWVHIWEAHRAGLNPMSSEYSRNSGSIYSDARRRRFLDMDPWSQLRAHWYWHFRTKRCKFKCRRSSHQSNWLWCRDNNFF